MFMFVVAAVAVAVVAENRMLTLFVWLQVSALEDENSQLFAELQMLRTQHAQMREALALRRQ